MNEYKENQLHIILLNELSFNKYDEADTDIIFDNIQQKIDFFNNSQDHLEKTEIAHIILASFQYCNYNDLILFQLSEFFENIKELIYKNNEFIMHEINKFISNGNLLKDAIIQFKIYDPLLFSFVSMNEHCKSYAINILSQMSIYNHCFLCSFYETILELKEIDDITLISQILIPISEISDCIDDFLKILQYFIVDLNFYQNSLSSFLILMQRSGEYRYKTAKSSILKFIIENLENISNDFLKISIECIELSLSYRKIPENFFFALNFDKLKNIFQKFGNEEETHRIAVFISHLYSIEDYFKLLHNTEIEKIIFEIFSSSCYEIKKEIASNIAISMRYIPYKELMTDFFQNIFYELISVAESGEKDIIAAIIDTIIIISDVNPDFFIYIQQFYPNFENIYLSTENMYMTDLLNVFLMKLDKIEE